MILSARTDAQGGKQAMKRVGFTLIEILIVIAVIAILMAILIPVIYRARDKAWLATCTGNMGKISRAVSLYTSDNNGGLPNRPQGLVWMSRYESTDLDSICCPALSVSMGRGFGFNLGLRSMPRSRRDTKAYLWDGKDLEKKFTPPSAGWWMPDWLDYRHRLRANICFLDGHIKPYPQPDAILQKSGIPASFF